MYGNHHTNHPSGYQSPDLGTGGYPYFSTGHHHLQNHHHQNVPAAYASSSNVLTTTGIQTASNGNSGNHFYSSVHPHLYSPTAIEYGIHTSSNNSPTDQYEKYYDAQSNDGYYSSTGNTGSSSVSGTSNNNNNPTSSSPETHIISSDNGLSYTNLDYIAYQQAHHNQAQGYNITIPPNDEKLSLNHHYNEELLLNNAQNPLHHHQHGHHNPSALAGNNLWHHPNSSNHNFMDASGGLVNQMQANLSSQQSLQQHAMHSPNSIQSSSPTLQNQSSQSQDGQSMQSHQQQQQNVPTYKWMQVKRNVPKPQSK